MEPLSGHAPVETAKQAVKEQIDAGLLIPTLILRHRDKAFEDYVWHWFLLNGYDERESGFLVKAVTYSEFEWLDFEKLWNTGYDQRGGLVLYRLK